MYRLPVSLRPLLAKPFGPVYQTRRTLDETKRRVVIAVGDVVTRTFLENSVLPKVMLVDGVTLRGTRVENALELLPTFGVRKVQVDNPPACITQELIGAIDRGLKEKGSTLVQVRGEEDLAALPAMILAPNGACVVYGQPREGMVVVHVDDKVRETAKSILNQMEVK